MRNLIAFVVSAVFISSAFAQVYVQPHQRSDGTHVEGHYRSSPNHTDRDNYSTRGNINPYTGKEGTRRSHDEY